MRLQLAWFLWTALLLFTVYSFFTLLRQLSAKEEGDEKYNWATLIVTAVCLLFLLSIPLKSEFPHLGFLCNIFLGGFIGGFTNTIAIRMLFEKYLSLPYTGALLIYREKIIRSLAETIESHIINAEELEKLLKGYVGEIDTEHITGSLNAFVDEVRGDIREYIKSEHTREEIKNKIRQMVKQLNFMGRLLVKIGLKGDRIDSLVDSIVSEVAVEVDKFKVSNDMIDPVYKRIGTIEEFIFQRNNAFLMKHYNTNESLISYILLSKLDMKKVVEEKLSRYSAEEVKNIIEKNIRSHLAWLEFYGVIIGCIFAGIFEGFLYFISA